MIPVSQELPAFYYDLQSLAPLKQAARENPENIETLRNVAQQFESMFMQMVLKSMRSASLGDSLFDTDQSLFYRDMFDQQLAVKLSGNGGMGLADMLVEQLSRSSMLSRHDPFAANRGGDYHGLSLAPDRPGMQPLNRPAAALAGISAARQASAVQPRTVTAGAIDSGPILPPSGKPSPSQDPAPVGAGVWTSPAEFVRDIWPHAVDAASQLGVDPKVLVAQSALETAWGSKLPHRADGRSSFNLFGIKAGSDWGGERTVVSTLEYEGDRVVSEKSAFRMYDSVADSMSDYVDFLKSRARYADALNNAADPEKYSRALQRAGYATDPVYADKILRVMQSAPFQDGLAGLADTTGKSSG